VTRDGLASRGCLKRSRDFSFQVYFMESTKTNPFSLTGEIALVTGGGSGLGLAMARSIVAAGGRVVLLGRREALLRDATADLGQNSSYLVHDVAKTSVTPGFADLVEAPFGPISILINNAGIHLKKPALATTEDEFQLVLATHVLGAHALTRELVPPMIARNRGSILFVASMTSLIGLPGVVAYSAAKSALLGMVRSLATELSASGIRVNAIAPGWINSPMMREALADDPVREGKILSRTPMRRFGDPSEIGSVAVFLSSPAASFVTGVCLPVDGGASIGF